MSATFDSENNLVLDFDSLVDSMSEQHMTRLALLLANRTPVMLFVAQLLADGMTFDDEGRWYYPDKDEMQEARLYLFEHFDEVQQRAIEEANSQRDEAKRQYDRERRQWIALDHAIEERFGTSVRCDLVHRALFDDAPMDAEEALLP